MKKITGSLSDSIYNKITVHDCVIIYIGVIAA